MKKALIGVAVAVVALGGGSYLWQQSQQASGDDAVAVVDLPASSEGGGGAGENANQTPSRPLPAERDYAVEFHRLLSQAEQGDKTAQLSLSEIYERCSGYAVAPERYIEGIKSLAATNGNQAVVVQALADRVAEQCRIVVNTDSLSGLAYQEWLMKAAQNGSLVANARLMTRSINTPRPENAKKVADLALAGRDAKALFETGELMARIEDSAALGAYSNVSGSGVGTYAWGVVGCRMGLDCSAGSNIMDSLCMNTGKCGYSSYEEFVRHEFVPAGEQGRLDQAIQFITNRVSSSPT
ncbi:hypothetical protein [Stenotrophomonas sp.]|uniref:hypothetical protein n=1 Tax=Stenotrophomonas sp. TaxID=69392 RepID=UPI0028ABD1BD|nr:hypothetical protein [Stenotrophomonas sp.]